jgi:hypothetical protein
LIDNFSNGAFTIVVDDIDNISIPNFNSIIAEPEMSSDEFLKVNVSQTFSFDGVSDAFHNLCNSSKNAYVTSVKFRQSIPVQIRKNKKRRINKKWAKKYGFTNLPVGKEYVISDCELEHLKCGEWEPQSLKISGTVKIGG